MKKLNGIQGVFNFIKLILKYAAYVTIVIEIANFALDKINPILNTNEAIPNEENASTGHPADN